MEEKKYCYKYPHPAVTTDCVIFGFDGRELQVLLIERGIEPFKGKWAFPGGFLKMDETAIIFFNLFSNAVKYTPEGGTITCTLRETKREDNKLAVSFDISDTGIGMSEQFQKVLFEPFT